MSASVLIPEAATIPNLLALLAEARHLHTQNRLKEAAERYGQALRCNPRSQTALLGLSLLARQTHQFDQATQMAEAAIRCSAPGSGESALAWAHLGHCHFALHRIADAQSAFEQAFKTLTVMLVTATSDPATSDPAREDRPDAEDAADGHSAKRFEAETLKQAKIEAHVGLGELFSASARPVEAIAHFEAAIDLQPNLAAAHYGLGSCRLIQSITSADFERALGCFKHAAQYAPTSPESHFAVGFIEGRQGRPRQAVDAYNRAVQHRPTFASAWLNMGVALVADGSEQLAEPCYRQAIAVLPVDSSQYRGATSSAEVGQAAAMGIDTRISALLNLGHLFRHRRHFEKASDEYQQALRLALANDLGSRLREVHVSLTYLHLESGDFGSAWQSLERAESLGSPAGMPGLEDPETLNAKGILILAEQYARVAPGSSQDLKRDGDSTSGPVAASLPESLQSRSERPIVHGLEEAIDAFSRAEVLGHKSAASNRGNTLLRLGRCSEALLAHEKAAELDPLNPGVLYNLALSQLRLGRYEEGWANYEIRWSFRDIHPRPRRFAQPRWNGEDLSGVSQAVSLFLYSEQGLGDTIQFLRYVPLVAQRLQFSGGRKAELTLEVKAPLMRLLAPYLNDIAEKFPGVITRLVCCEDTLPNFSHHCPLLSLPAVFRTRLDTIPPICPAVVGGQTIDLNFDASLVATRAASLLLLPNSDQPRIGIAWAGNPNYRADFERSTHLATFLPLLELSQFCWISLQKGGSSTTTAGHLSIEQQFAEIPEQLRPCDASSEDRDLADTAALIANLDLVITTDTSIAHVAGALGKPLWLLLPWQSDWRWMQDTLETPWYPTARLFRQAQPGDWEELMGRVASELLRHFA